MHDIGCSRQNYKCKQCGLCVAKADKEDHDAEAHADVVCPDCAFTAPKFRFGNHAEECKMKPKPCEFCEQVVPHLQFSAHYEQCGSKTFKCADCNDCVRNLDKAAHKSSGMCDSI